MRIIVPMQPRDHARVNAYLWAAFFLSFCGVPSRVLIRARCIRGATSLFPIPVQPSAPLCLSTHTLHVFIHPFLVLRAGVRVGGTWCKGECQMEGCVRAPLSCSHLGELDSSHPLVGEGGAEPSLASCPGQISSQAAQERGPQPAACLLTSRRPTTQSLTSGSALPAR